MFKLTTNPTPLNVRVVNAGDKYGRYDCLTHDKPEPMVEFYDARYDHECDSGRGQFVSRYYKSTLTDDAQRLCDSGLCLDGGVPSWSVTPAAMRELFSKL